MEKEEKDKGREVKREKIKQEMLGKRFTIYIGDKIRKRNNGIEEEEKE